MNLALNSKESSENRDRIWYGYFEYLRFRVENSLRCSFSLEDTQEQIPASWIYPYLSLPGFTHVTRKMCFTSLHEYKALCTPDPMLSSQAHTEEITRRLIQYRLEILDGYEVYKRDGAVEWRTSSQPALLPHVSVIDADPDLESDEEDTFSPPAITKDVPLQLTQSEVEERSLDEIYQTTVTLPSLAMTVGWQTISYSLKRKIKFELERRILGVLPDECFKTVIYSACSVVRNVLSPYLHAGDTAYCSQWTQHYRVIITDNWSLLRLGAKKLVIVRDSDNDITSVKCSYLLNQRRNSDDPWFSDKVGGLGQFKGFDIIHIRGRMRNCIPTLKMILEP